MMKISLKRTLPAILAILTLVALNFSPLGVTPAYAATNVALGKTATASSVDNASRPASLAVDGNINTRWSSAYSAPQWIQIDLGAVYDISQVVLRWETAYGSAYEIQTSNNASTWTTIYTEPVGNLAGGVHTLDITGQGQYIRMYGTVRGTQWGFSLWEFEVYGVLADFTDPVGSIDSGPLSPTKDPSATFTFSATDNATVAPNFTFLCALDGGAQVDCSSGTVTYNGLGSGLHTFDLEVRDEAGNPDYLTYNWTVDLVAPVVSIDSAPSDPTNSPSATFDFSATDNLTVAPNFVFQCNLDGGAQVDCSSGTVTYNGLGSGLHTFDLEVRDEAGNPDYLTYNWTVDLVAPVVSIDSAPSDPTNSPSATFDFSATDNLTVAPNFVFQCNLDSAGWVDCSTGTVTYNGLADGLHSFALDVYDEVGNKDSLGYYWFVDLTTPTASIDSGPAHPTRSTSATFEFSATDYGSITPNLVLEQNLTFWCDLDGLGWEDCTSDPGTWSYTGLGEGWHTFRFYARDAAGNTSTIQTYGWYIDLTPPDASIDSAPSNPSNYNIATFEFSATDDWTNASLSTSGFTADVSFFCKLDGGAWVGCDSGTITYTGLAEGPHTFYLDTYDQVGNLTSLSYTWLVDFTPTNVRIAQWTAPDGLPDGVTATELYLTSVKEFNFLKNGKAYQYAPPKPWLLFAGAGYNLESTVPFTEPIKICFYYPKANFSDGKWYGKIYFLDGDKWVGVPTTQETLSGFAQLPFLCTNATQPGLYIVADGWAKK